MTAQEYVEHFTEALRRNPALPLPHVQIKTHADLTDWKKQSRAYDQARLDLGLATAEQIQRQNSALRIKPNTTRIVQFAKYDNP